MDDIDTTTLKVPQHNAETPSPSDSQQTVAADRSETESDVLIVGWDGPDDPENPKNWTFRRKWAAAWAVSAFTFISPLSSSIIAPASEQIAQDFTITDSAELTMTISVFVLAYAIGPLFLGPLSEVYGRSRILQLANLFFLVWNLACGFAQTKVQLIVFRFFAGLGGSAPLSVGGGVLSDMFIPEQRGKAIGVYSLAPLLGPCVGPIAGGWMSQKLTWRWSFYVSTIADAFVQLLGLFYLQETYAPLLLERKAAKIHAQLDPEKAQRYHTIRTIYQSAEPVTWKHIMSKSLIRPFVLFAQEPIIQLFGIYMAFVYGSNYLVLCTLPFIYTATYHETPGIVGLHYLSLTIGMTLCAQINSRMLDYVYKLKKAQNNGVGKPEYRLLVAIPGSCFLPIGLFLSGWGPQKHVHWIVPDIGFAFIGIGAVATFQGMTSYVIDSFTRYAASALAAVSCFRSLAGFGFPLFAPAMYDALGYGIGDTILAVFSLSVGIPALVVFYFYGERIRSMSRRASQPHVVQPVPQR
ncbi:MFS polyamine transporter [Abortiporus biennis]|nr:MFS polyamine transporter [Abortiporus biennis]